METITTNTELKPAFKLLYNEKNITKDISDSYIQITYTDKEHGEADEIAVDIEDTTGKWKDAWYPTKGDSLGFYMGYMGQKLLPCGPFEIDEPHFMPAVISIKGISTSIKKALREKTTKRFKNTTLKKVAQSIAKKHGLTLIGTIKDIKIGTKTQKMQTDLNFLKKLAEAHGYLFKITGNKLVFYSIGTLENVKSVFTVVPEDLADYDLGDKTAQTYSACEVTYFDHKKNKKIKVRVENKSIVKADTLKINAKCSNKDQAITMANAGLKKVSYQVEGTIKFKKGNPKACAGVNFDLKKMGKLNGKYKIVTSTHSITKGGAYETTCEVKKIA